MAARRFHSERLCAAARLDGLDRESLRRDNQAALPAAPFLAPGDLLGRPVARLPPSSVRRVGRVLLGLAVLGILPCCWQHREEYVRVAVRRGDLAVTVSASGSLEALEQVSVPSEVTGTITHVYVRVNDSVEARQPLCRIDPEHYELVVSRAEAQLVTEEATSSKAREVLKAAEVALARGEQRAAKSPKAAAELDGLRAAVEAARSEEQLAIARVSGATTELDAARTALERTVIRSPISGVVVSRAVEPGQTIAANLAAPVVFVLARDLRRMVLRVFVDEADVAQLAVGQTATFSVDAVAERAFPARLTSIRSIPVLHGDAVGFEARLEVDNSEALLTPGMLARVAITTAERTGAVLVPNASLRFAPAFSLAGEQRSLAQGRPLRPSTPGSERTVWLATGAPVPQARRIAVGLSDGSWTEALGGGISPGDELAVDERVGGN
jgi:HlyD family secretion protein